MLNNFSQLGLSPGDFSRNTVACARPVETERVALPPVAGLCEPAAFLHDRQLDQYQNLSQLVLPESEWHGHPPKPCMMITPLEEAAKLRKVLISSNMACLIEEHRVPTDS